MSHGSFDFTRHTHVHALESRCGECTSVCVCACVASVCVCVCVCVVLDEYEFYIGRESVCVIMRMSHGSFDFTRHTHTYLQNLKMSVCACVLTHE